MRTTIREGKCERAESISGRLDCFQPQRKASGEKWGEKMTVSQAKKRHKKDFTGGVKNCLWCVPVDEGHLCSAGCAVLQKTREALVVHRTHSNDGLHQNPLF